MPNYRVGSAELLELRGERQKGGSDCSFDHLALSLIADQHSQNGRVDIASDLARIGMNTSRIRRNTDEPFAVPAIEHVVSRTAEDLQRCRTVQRPPEFHIEFNDAGICYSHRGFDG
jgi:hypothetical protein